MAETDDEPIELPLDGVGTRLRRAREAAGLQLRDIAARTRIAERHLVSIEDGNFSAMASRAYAVGFARSYARALGMDEQAIADAVREEMGGQEPGADRYQPAAFEPGDPARVPSAKIAWMAALGALLGIVLVYVFWRSFYAPAMPPPDPADEATPSAAASTPASAAPQPSSQGPVVFTALAQGIWVKFYDAAGNQLMQKQMALGESYTVPPEASGPMIRTARPDALQISVGGKVVAKLSDMQTSIKDVPVSAMALLARGSTAQPGTAAPTASGAPAASAATTATAAATATHTAAPSPRPTPPRERPRPSPTAAPSAAEPAASPLPAATPTAQSSTVSQ